MACLFHVREVGSPTLSTIFLQIKSIATICNTDKKMCNVVLQPPQRNIVRGAMRLHARVFSPDEDELLTEEIRKHNVLYNISNSRHNDIIF